METDQISSQWAIRLHHHPWHLLLGSGAGTRQDPGLARRLVSLLDGTRDRAALVEGLLPLIDSGEATVKVDNQPVMDRTAARFLMEEQLEEALTNIARIPLLIG